MNYARIILMALLLAALAAIPAAAQKPGGNGGTKPPAGSPAGGCDADAEYTIGPDDVLNIAVWKEPELTKTLQVRPDGKISMPLLHDVQAVGLTPVQLSQSIAEKLRKFMNDPPQVTVIVQTINSRRIYIMGEVGRAGAFPMMPCMTVLQALASAGNFSQFANLKSIYILRSENGKQVKYPFNYKDVIKGNRPEQNILLKPGDTIVVP
jgi:polysaccharide export outer membrane protein